ncbi:hypothetical protein MTR_1g021460 [Medicago truncatula]|uniref:Uncharacterized protein n=1 Tax=Medicago truncatula TaxID=3880 RepID=G7I580_MEDTR|nr:hypothetical protein MTR_1g021460 [Medicago truncatula]
MECEHLLMVKRICRAAEGIRPYHPKSNISFEEGISKIGNLLGGKLIYLVHISPDLACVSVVSLFINGPRVRHLQVVDHILRYLQDTVGRGLLSKLGGRLTMEAYIDVDYPGSVRDRRSISIYCAFLYVLAKGLPSKRFNQLTCKQGMIDIHSPA